MFIHTKLEGNDIYLKCLGEDDVNEEYVAWMNDREINKYMETRHQCWSSQEIKDYVNLQNTSEDQLLLGIFLYSGKHIGNIKLGLINKIHFLASVSLFIGSPNGQGKGYSIQAINLLKDYSFHVMGLKKLIAGMYSDNIASLRAFLKSGFQLEGIFKNHYELGNGKRTDIFQVGCISQ